MEVLAFDTETHLISYPSAVNPPGVCFSYSKGGDSGVLSFKHDRAAIEQLMREHLTSGEVVGHNVAFDLHVLLREIPGLLDLVWAALGDGRIHDTMVLEKLHLLSTTGNCNARVSLAVLAEKYCDIDMSASKEGDDIWRLRYAELEDLEISEYPAEAFEYARLDAVYTRDVYDAMLQRIPESGPGSAQSESLQVASAYCLRGMEIQGIETDASQVAKLEDEYGARYEGIIEVLKQHGLVREGGSRDAAAIAKLAEAEGVTARTATGRIKTDRATLETNPSQHPGYKALLEYSGVLKAVSTFIPQMRYPIIHPRFNVMVNTLRTSCASSNYHKYEGQQYGVKVKRMGDPTPSINFQQIPRDPAFREVFVPGDGRVFLCADYSNLELVCAGQIYKMLFGHSKLADTLNTGVNMHDVLGCQIYNDTHEDRLDVEDFRAKIRQGDKDAKACRQSAKPVNLGCPGGQSAKTIHALATTAYGLDITLEQAEHWHNMAKGQFPEFDKFFRHYLPSRKVGTMAMKDSEGNWMSVDRYDIEIEGVYMAKKTFTAAANGISMQCRAALGGKMALCMLYKEIQTVEDSPLYGARLHAFIHDEFLISVEAARAEPARARMAEIMLAGMAKVCPDMRVGCEAMIMQRWGKDAEDTKEYHRDPVAKKERINVT